MTKTLIIATDGSALSNPGPAGWCWFASPTCWGAQGTPHATNNAAELNAIRDALAAIPTDVPVELRLDSQYSLDALTKWRFGWARNGWRTKTGTAVANAELIQEIGRLLPGRTVTFVKVRAHQSTGGDPRNEAADRLARGAARAVQQGGRVNNGPGFVR